MRISGSRSFELPVSPSMGRSLSHPDFDKFWSAAEDLGMFCVLHVGADHPSLDVGWSNTGRGHLAESAFLMFNMSSEVLRTALTAMVCGGVFERHPGLIVLGEEFGLNWVPAWIDTLDKVLERIDIFGEVLGGWHLPLRPSEYVRRNIRFSALPGDPIADVINEVGSELVLFSSDFPHVEGSRQAVKEVRSIVDSKIDTGASRQFFGGNMAELLSSGN
jgi:uncharacterized protein